MICFLKALPAAILPTYGLTPARTGDLIDVNDATRLLKDKHGKASSFTKNKRGAKRGVNPSFGALLLLIGY
jgi:hypothetical protein